MSSTSSPFGQNEWLVEEMYRKFREDPSSVDASWHEFLVDYNPEPTGDARAAVKPATPAAAPPPPAPTPTPPPPAAPPAPSVSGNGAPSAPAPAAKPAGPPPGDGDEVQVLRGAAAAVVKNMSQSLDLPTATSVRAIPAKLMIDNRTVINNQLKRTRGGKISFTHMLGYALVQAVKAFPNMNRHYAEVDGKPTSVTPAHINLGLAIDLKGKDGKRTLVVAAIKRCETMRFGQFVAAYEDIVRRARDGKLDRRRLCRRDDFVDQPRHHRHRALGAAADGGPGRDHRRGSNGVPGRTPGCQRGTHRRTGYRQADHPDLDLRPPHHPGRGIGRLPAHHPRMVLADDFWDEIFREMGVPYLPIRWSTDNPDSIVDKNARVMELIAAYRNRGHLMADIDPLRLDKLRFRSHPDLEVLTHGLTLWDLDRVFKVNGFAGSEYKKLRDILGLLRDAYCRHIGVEYTHILDPEQQEWLEERVETKHVKPTVAQQKYILSKLNAAEAFETFLQTKYVGQKRFSLEGAESTIPLMDAAIDQCAEHGLDEVVIAMPHRGRLNVLANIVGKPYSQIFSEFEGNLNPAQAHGSGDVKYHLGATGVYLQMFGDNDIQVSLTANPSHLEAVDPVLEGLVRAKQDLLDKGEGERGNSVVPMMLHGDAAFAGQGVVAETLNLAKLPGYRVGGTIHIIVNNQIGFTTAPEYSRSSEYCTDVAKMIGAPIFHVNGDDPEACVWVAKLAVDFRQKFKKDVIIDMLCYRRRGHNEGDDPSMTNPYMYDVVDVKRGVRKTYTEALIGRGDISMKEAEDALRDYQGQLERVFNDVRELEKHGVQASMSVESNQMLAAGLDTAVDKALLARIGDAFLALPEGFAAHPRVIPVLEKRREMAYEGKIDWAFGELLALGSLVAEGKLIRLSGQDTRRGTFSQRHSVVIDRQTGEEFTPLQLLTVDKDGNPTGGKFMVFDSPLSEYAAVGFEYGYTVGNPDALVLWEGQFGDFVNGAQSIIDEFISSGEAKWGQLSSVVLLLPHGHEGQGPDHTSGRIERFLQLWAEGSMTIAVPSTPANYFHLLRRHALDGVQRPLIVFTPKSMLRNKAAVSDIKEFTETRFHSVLEEPTYEEGIGDRSKATRILLTSGKIYYELAARKAKDNRDDVAIVRIEQLAPLPWHRLSDTLDRYPNVNQYFWVQEEPANQGAWPRFGLELPELFPDKLTGIKRISRRAMSAPSSGSSKVHAVEQQEIIDEAFR